MNEAHKPSIKKVRFYLTVTLADGVPVNWEMETIKERKFKRDAEGRFASTKPKELIVTCPRCGSTLKITRK